VSLASPHRGQGRTLSPSVFPVVPVQRARLGLRRPDGSPETATADPVGADAPAVTDGPVVPAARAAVAAPVAPVAADLPVVPEVPVAHGMPVVPVAPEVPAVPVAPEVPVAPRLPVAPEVPAASAPPDVRLAPEVPVGPDAAGGAGQDEPADAAGPAEERPSWWRRLVTGS
jgi:hypothetical protein